METDLDPISIASLQAVALACNRSLKARQPIQLIVKKIKVPMLRNNVKLFKKILKKLRAKGYIIIRRNHEENYCLTRYGWEMFLKFEKELETAQINSESAT